MCWCVILGHWPQSWQPEREIPVGFVMYRQLTGTDIAWIQRIMIDVRYQNKGYGRVALVRSASLRTSV